ncbi:MAG: hypothetical protein P4L84_29520 [Isosphaeraceae bacterium]|nr:hypothetical protein [Isosphaeraceae bacterium]
MISCCEWAGRKGYNCFSSAVGSLLAGYGYPALAPALDSGFDFYYQPSSCWRLGSLGVWPGSEHGMVARNLKRLFGVDVTVREEESWGTVVARLARPGHPLVMALANKSLAHIPRGELVELVPHYLVLSGGNGGEVRFRDAFLGQAGALTLDDLERASCFVTDDGEEVRYRVCELSGITIPGRVVAEYAASPGKLARDMLLPDMALPSLERGDAAVVGPEAIRRVATDLESMGATANRRNLRVLGQSLRYVQYQRTCFGRFLGEFGTIRPDLAATIDALIARLHALGRSWFDVRVRAQYLALRSTGPAVAPVVGVLRVLADEEGAFLQQLRSLKSTLSDEE